MGFLDIAYWLQCGIELGDGDMVLLTGQWVIFRNALLTFDVLNKETTSTETVVTLVSESCGTWDWLDKLFSPGSNSLRCV
jgi:hypothetical protein